MTSRGVGAQRSNAHFQVDGRTKLSLPPEPLRTVKLSLMVLLTPTVPLSDAAPPVAPTWTERYNPQRGDIVLGSDRAKQTHLVGAERGAVDTLKIAPPSCVGPSVLA